MKLDIKVEIDWIGEDQTIDDAVKQSIIREITSRINSKVIDDIQETVKRQIEDQAESTVDKVYTEMLEQRNIVITDTWGNNKREYTSVKQMIEEKFDNYLHSYVDNNGKPTSKSSYGSKETKIEWMIKNTIEKQSKDFVKKVVGEVTKTTSEYLNDQMKTVLGEEIAKSVGIDKVVAKLQSGK